MIVKQNSTYENIDGTIMKGFELKANNYSLQRHDIELSYAYINAKDKDNNNINNIPASKLFIQDSMEINAKTKFLISYLYVDKRESLYQSTKYILDDYSLVDAQLSYEPSKSLLCKFGVKNIFDYNWEFSHGQPALGRSLFANLNYKY